MATQFPVTRGLARLAKPILFLVSFHTAILALEPSLNLGTTSVVFGPDGGIGSVVVGASAAWTAATDADWLHIKSGNQTGSGNGLLQFTYDANHGATRTGSIRFNGEQALLTVTQAAESYVSSTEVTTLVSSSLSSPGPGYRRKRVFRRYR